VAFVKEMLKHEEQKRMQPCLINVIHKMRRGLLGYGVQRGAAFAGM
jgi:hypothetical protein